MLVNIFFYTNLLIWGLGAGLAILLLLTAMHHVAWWLYGELVGWPTIAKAMRLYRASEATGEDAVRGEGTGRE